MKRAVIMSRVSSDEQAKGFSLGVQFEQLTNYCKRRILRLLRIIKKTTPLKTSIVLNFKTF